MRTSRPFARSRGSWSHLGYFSRKDRPRGPDFFLLKKFEYVITCVITKTYERTNYTKNIKNKQTEEMTTLTVTTIGNSLGILLPKEVTQRLEIQKGDKLFLTNGPDGYRITVYDPEFEEQMNLARKIMKNRRNALRQLAEMKNEMEVD